MYNGDLKNDDTVLGWITKELRDTGIHEVNPEVLNSILERVDYVAVVYYDKTKKSDLVRKEHFFLLNFTWLRKDTHCKFFLS